MGNVVIAPAAAASMTAAWQQRTKQQRQSRSPPLYQNAEEYLQLVNQVRLVGWLVPSSSCCGWVWCAMVPLHTLISTNACILEYSLLLQLRRCPLLVVLLPMLPTAARAAHCCCSIAHKCCCPLLLLQVLSRDIRSLHQRQQAAGRQPAVLHVQAAASTAAQPSSVGPTPGQGSEKALNGVHLAVEQQAGLRLAATQDEKDIEGLPTGKYHVVLDGVDISYDCDSEGNIIVGQAQVHS